VHRAQVGDGLRAAAARLRGTDQQPLSWRVADVEGLVGQLDPPGVGMDEDLEHPSEPADGLILPECPELGRGALQVIDERPHLLVGRVRVPAKGDSEAFTQQRVILDDRHTHHGLLSGLPAG
jgi:hypothetical protein